MASYAYSKLVLGVPVEFKLTETKTTVTRFDPTTGKPYEVESRDFDIEATICELTCRLPPAKRVFIDAIYAKEMRSYDFDLWQDRSGNKRVNEWFESIGFSGSIKLFQEYPGKMRGDTIIGRQIADGSDMDPMKKVPNIISQNNQDLVNYLADKLCGVFGCAKIEIELEYFLLTTLS